MSIFTDTKALQSWFERVKSDRASVESVWQEISDNLFGMRNFTSPENQTIDTMRYIYDTTALASLQLLAGGLHGIMTPPAGMFLELEVEPRELMKDPDVRFWLEDSRNRTLAYLHNADTGWNTNLAEIYLDLPGFGMGAMWIDPHPVYGVCFSARPLQEVYVEEDFRGKVDVIFRELRMTARQFRQRFPNPIERVEPVEKAIEKKEPETTITVNQIVARSDDPMAGTTPFRKPWQSTAWTTEGNKVARIETKGYDEKPIPTPRWSVDTSQIYGKGCGHNALPDGKMTNAMMKTIIKYAQKASDPPLLISSESVLSAIRTQPGGLIYVQDQPGIGGQPDAVRPLRNDARHDITVDLLDRKINAIQTCFWSQVLQLFAKPNMSATEVIALGVQAQRLMAPITGRVAEELHEPAIDRTVGVLMRGRRFLPVPPIMRGAEVRPKFVSALTRAQSVSEAESVMQAWQGAAMVAEASQSMDALDVLDAEESVRLLHKYFQAPQSIIRDIREVQDRQAQRSQLAMEDRYIQQAGAGAEVVSKLSQVSQRAALPRAA